MLYYLGLSNISSTCIQAGLFADLELLSEVASISNSLADVLSSSWLCFSALRLDFEVACFTRWYGKNAKVGAIGLEQSCKSPSFAKFGEKMDAFLKVGPQKLRLALCRYFKRQWWCVMLCQGSETYIHASLEQSRPSTESGRAKWRQHWPFLSPTNRGENSRGIAGQWQYCCQLPARRQDQKGQKVKSWNQWCSNMTVK